MSEYLSLAKSINVAQVFLPSNLMDDIDKLNVNLNTVADTLSEKTSENFVKITKVFKAVYVFFFMFRTVIWFKIIMKLCYLSAYFVFLSTGAQL